MQRTKLLFSGVLCILCILATFGCNRGAPYYLGRGNQLFDARKYSDASLQYQKALQKDPNSGEAYYRLGLAELEEKKIVEAFQAFSQATKLMPGHNDAKVKLADLSLAAYLGNPGKAKAYYNEVVSLSEQLLAGDPNSFDGLRLKGSLALLERRPIEAIEHFRKANQVKPMQRDLILAYVQALFQNNQLREGEQLGLELIGKEKSFGEMYDVMYRSYLDQHRIADAEKILKTKAESNPQSAPYALQLAVHYAQARKPTEMEAQLQRLLADPNSFPQARLQVGDFYKGLGNRTEALRQYEEGARANPKDQTMYRKRMVDILLADGKRDEAAGIVDLILKDQPKDIQALTGRATLWLESGKPENLDKVLGEFQALVHGNPDDPLLWFSLGRAQQAKGNLDAARGAFQEALKRRQDSLPARVALAQISLAQNNPQEALRYTDAILSLDPNNPRARLFRSVSLTKLGNYTQARLEVNRLLKDFPGSLDGQLQLGVIAVAEKKYKEAEEIFRKSQQPGGSDPRLALGLAQTYSSQHQLERALQVLNEESKKSPDSASVQRMLIVTSVRAGKYDLAIDACRQLISRTPKSAQPYLLLSEVYGSKGDFDNAIASLEKAAEVAPADAAVAISLADRLNDAGRLEQAKTNYRRTLALQPENAAASNNLAFLLAETGGNLDEALKLAEQANRKIRDQPFFADTLGWIYLKKNMPGPALQIFNNLVKKHPGNPSFQYHLGAALLSKGDTAKARSALNAALANKPNKQEEEKIRTLLATLG